METMKMKMLATALTVLMFIALSSVNGVSAADPPAPGPTSDAATTFIPTFFASVAAIVFALLF
ncbi:arabinogalactan peptide 14-like [Olea europaea var. sylvestris]|uniref:arabinogalactan peptide 14-like n=1 Tax=Olea europaea var. sylvestris TaxID=158386 RepID=UPI000C1CFF20|nr:arabinogalactan peptide 14-like [Olea europaea var. sylvestris]